MTNSRKLVIEIEMDNAAFDDGFNGAQEASRILRDFAGRCEVFRGFADSKTYLYDINGNRVGWSNVKEVPLKR